ncbi:MAG: DUF1232 domain-containing protein [Gammaproteobacteria bacterium]|nr:DUF1232 domain-containing protein [Gammaproteobacteria bacterium]
MLPQKNWRTFFRTALQNLRQHALSAFFLARHPRTPVLARLLLVLIVAYAFSPIDFIPDFIPILGQLDDLLFVSLGIFIVRQLVSASLWNECADMAKTTLAKPPSSKVGLFIVIALWLIIISLSVYYFI